MNNTEQQTESRDNEVVQQRTRPPVVPVTVRKALGIAADAFRLRQLEMKHDWYRFPWTCGPEMEPCLIGPEYLGNVIIGVTPDGMYTYEARPGEWQDVHPAHPEFLVDAVIEDRAGKPFPLPRRSHR